MTSPVPEVDLGPDWVVLDRTVAPAQVRQVVERGEHRSVVLLERAATGVFRDAFPVGEHDLRVDVDPLPEPRELTELLGLFRAQFNLVDPDCRRLVYAAPEDDLTVVAAAEQAGFRYVVDVEVSTGSYSLMVVEPDRVTSVDMDLDRVPQT